MAYFHLIGQYMMTECSHHLYQSNVNTHLLRYMSLAQQRWRCFCYASVTPIQSYFKEEANDNETVNFDKV